MSDADDALERYGPNGHAVQELMDQIDAADEVTFQLAKTATRQARQDKNRHPALEASLTAASTHHRLPYRSQAMDDAFARASVHAPLGIGMQTLVGDAAQALVVADLATEPAGPPRRAALAPMHLGILTGRWQEVLATRAALSDLARAQPGTDELVTTLLRDGWDADLSLLAGAVTALLHQAA